MNKNGFTLVELLTIIVVISIILLIVYPSITNIMQENNTELYKSYENMMVEYAKVSPLRSRNRIKLTELPDLYKLIGEGVCSGYVNITHGSTITYTPYIKCGDKYTTVGFNAAYA